MRNEINQKLANILNIHPKNDGSSTGLGRWYANSEAKFIESINPADEQVIAMVRPCLVDDYAKIVQDSHAAQLQWRQVPAPKRGEFIRRIGEALREKKDALGSLVSLETGKLKEEGDGEVQEMIDMADFAVGQSRMLYGNTMHSERAQHRMYEQWQPLGMVGVISAFNFPVAVWAWNAFIAAICGNTIIWKPSSTAPLCAIAVQHICNHVMQEMGYQGVLSLFIPASRDIAEHMLEDKQLKLISFTGSSRVGRHVGEVVAKRMGKSLLELSGNNAIIVSPSAELDLAIPAIVFGAVGTAGQRCTTTRRLFIHESIFEKILTALIQAYQQIRIGDPLDKAVLMGPLISKTAVAAYQSTIKGLQEKNADIVCGGNVLDLAGYFVEPTIVVAEHDWAEVQHETFAPILYVMKYAVLAEAIEQQNAVMQGLSSAIFTNDMKEAELFLSSVGSDCGIANVNIGTSGAEIGGAFGGEKDTGGGREAGSDSWKAYMRRQTTTINWGDELPLAQGIKFALK